MALDRFESKFSKTDSCWIWNAATRSTGYGVFSFNGKPQTASRVSYILYKGDIPPGMHVCHSCDNRICVNPDHLFLGTNKDNVEDRKAKGRRAGRFKVLSEDDIVLIQNLLQEKNLSYRGISRQTGFSRESIRRVALGTY